MTKVRPIYLLSLPRAGSTLVQRVLGTRSEIATTAEPWVLLPLLYALRDHGAYSEYGHRLMTNAISDFCTQLEGGRDAWLAEVREMATRLYQRASPPHARYFLDKTPRYHLVAGDLLRAFPDAKVIFLWRNPLAVAASMVETWYARRWHLHRVNVDLYDGIDSLLKAHGGARRAHSVRYEDLALGDPAVWSRLFDYLELDWRAEALSDFASVSLRGRKGDPSGVKKYAGISSASVEAWPATYDSALRKRWARHYLTWLGEGRLRQMGYDRAELERLLAGAPNTGSTARDLLDAARSLASSWSEPTILRDKLQRWSDGRAPFPHA